MYHMHGINMGSLYVYQTFNSLKLEDPLWFDTGTQGDMWHHAIVDIDQKAGHRVRSERMHSYVATTSQ